jgi:glycogen(starch) synthase
LVTLHGEVLRRAPDDRDSLLKKTLRAATWVACVSNAVLERARELAPEIAGRSSVIHNGLEPSPILPTPLPFAPPRLLCLGRLIPEKGFDLALTAFVTLACQFPDARLVIAGDGPMRHPLEEQARELGLAERVQFTGWVAAEKVSELINTATLVVMPSRREGLPLVGIQAAQMARPVVATRVGGLPELVVEGETGWLVQQEDSKALAEAVALLIEHPARAQQMGQAAQHRAQEFFGWTRYLDAMDALYQKVSLRDNVAISMSA